MKIVEYFKEVMENLGGNSRRSVIRDWFLLYAEGIISSYLDILSVGVQILSTSSQILSTRSKILSVNNQILSVSFFRVKRHSDELWYFQLFGYAVRVFKILSGYGKYYPEQILARKSLSYKKGGPLTADRLPKKILFFPVSHAALAFVDDRLALFLDFCSAFSALFL